MTDALQTQREIRRQLIADISHELNTPLSIMRLEAQGMTDGMQTPEEAARNIQREIDLLSGLITDLELIAEADQQAIQLVKGPVAVAVFLQRLPGAGNRKRIHRASSYNLRLNLSRLRSTSTPPECGRYWTTCCAMRYNTHSGRTGHRDRQRRFNPPYPHRPRQRMRNRCLASPPPL